MSNFPLRVTLFICPNSDNFHPTKGEYVEYLIVPQAKFKRISAETAQGNVDYYVLKQDPDCFVFLDDPPDGLVTAILSHLVGTPVIRFTRTCVHCHRKGIKTA